MQKQYRPKLNEILTVYRATLPVVEVSTMRKLSIFYVCWLITTCAHIGIRRKRCRGILRGGYQVFKRLEELELASIELPQDVEEYCADQGAGTALLHAVQQLPGAVRGWTRTELGRSWRA